MKILHIWLMITISGPLAGARATLWGGRLLHVDDVLDQHPDLHLCLLQVDDVLDQHLHVPCCVIEKACVIVCVVYR
jgi:hypothetical protein